MHEDNDCSQCQRVEAQKAENIERELRNKRIQASNICIDIYNDFDQQEVMKMTQVVQRAWGIGRDIYNLVSK